MQIYKFRNCLLNPVERTVIKESQCVELTTKTFDVLLYLIENAGKVVTKDEILGTCWNGNFVEESNLPVHISKLRRSLGDNGANRFIETVQGTGYRFVAPTQIVTEEEWQSSLVYTTVRLDSTFSSTGMDSDSIAVLPLQNESGDPNNEYLANGLTEGLINGLCLIPGVRVIARSSVFGVMSRNAGLTEVARNLGVSKLVTGRISILGDELVVGIELISPHDSKHIWGARYTGRIEELIPIQNEILVELSNRVTASTFRKGGSSQNSLARNPESYRLYLKGRYFLEKHSADDMYTATRFFESSLSLDPKNVHTNAELYACYSRLYSYEYISYSQFIEKTKPILAAVAKETEFTDVVDVMYCDLRMWEWKFDEAATHCRRALAFNPNCIKARLHYSNLLLLSRNFEGALEQLEKVAFIDPLSPQIYKRLGRHFYVTGDWANALAYLNDALYLEPRSYEALAVRGAVYLEDGEYELAMNDLTESLAVEPHAEVLSMIGVVFARQGNRRKALQVLKQLEGQTTSNSDHSITRAHIYMALGKKDEVYKCLEQAFDIHEPDLRALTYDCRWLPLHKEERFRALVKRVGLPRLP